jgi:MFS family permease
MAGDAVKISPGVTGSLLGPGALVAAAVATVAFAFTPLAIAEPAVFFGYAFAIGIGMALMGLAMSVLSLLEGRSSSTAARRRGAAIGLGILGIVLCGGAIATLVALWLWLPGAVAYTPFGSTTTNY